MFVKKDKRKIIDILADPSDDRTSLLLARRGLEFGDARNTRPLFAGEPSALSAVSLLSLYNSKLTSVSGFSALVKAGSPLDSLVLGANELTSLPSALAGVAGTLRRFWCEDNYLAGPLPQPLLACTRLRVCRLSGNALTTADGIGALTQLEELALDGNALTSLPSEIGLLRLLRVLQVRGNALTELPEEVGDCAALESLYASSNRLKNLPRALGRCTSLKLLTVNGNARLTTLPAELAAAPSLTRVVAANCAIVALPLALVAAWARSLPPPVVAAAGVLVWSAAVKGILEGLDADLSAWESVCAARREEEVDEIAAGAAEDEDDADDGEGEGGVGGGSRAVLRSVLHDAAAEDALFFHPFVPVPLATLHPLHVDISGNALVEASNVAALRRTAACQELRVALMPIGGGSMNQAQEAVVEANHGAQLIVKTVALREARRWDY